MDTLYDEDSARIKLAEEIIRRNKNGSTKQYQLCLFHDDLPMAHSVRVIPMGKPGSEKKWQLGYTPRPGDPTEELVLSVQGIVQSKALPPLPARFTKTSNKGRAKYMKQGVTLTGLGVPEFSAALEAVDRIKVMFSRYSPSGNVKSTESHDADDGHERLHASNRYVTPAYECQGEAEVAIDGTVDPFGVLRRIVELGDFKYTEDNRVHYYERMSKDAE
ncbi:hypothetical protein HGRIS_000548 [Hohenbuehelia grisea]|uniref:Uncharacterized protein n=1 Tax=Hohenbuehelia grisea TaxID=104357 RepID=A0ABR3JRJ2_9AGAR